MSWLRLGLARFSRVGLQIILPDREVELVKYINPKYFNTELSKGQFQQTLLICCKSEKWSIVFPEYVVNVKLSSENGSRKRTIMGGDTLIPGKICLESGGKLNME